MARFEYHRPGSVPHDSDRALSFSQLYPADKRTRRPLYAIHVGRAARLTLSEDEAQSLGEALILATTKRPTITHYGPQRQPDTEQQPSPCGVLAVAWSSRVDAVTCLDCLRKLASEKQVATPEQVAAPEEGEAFDPERMSERASVARLSAALRESTDNGALDNLAAFVHPDVINQFCDAVADMRKPATEP